MKTSTSSLKQVLLIVFQTFALFALISSIFINVCERVSGALGWAGLTTLLALVAGWVTSMLLSSSKAVEEIEDLINLVLIPTVALGVILTLFLASSAKDVLGAAFILCAFTGSMIKLETEIDSDVKTRRG